MSYFRVSNLISKFEINPRRFFCDSDACRMTQRYCRKIKKQTSKLGFDIACAVRTKAQKVHVSFLLNFKFNFIPGTS